MTEVQENTLELTLQSKDQWLTLEMSLAGDHEDGPFLYYPNQFHLDIEPIDSISRGYTLHNWESGILSGIFYASRRNKLKPSNWLVHKLKGRLGSDAMDALALAAGEIVNREAKAGQAMPTTPGWVFAG